jgi:hypothetical protein
MTDGEGEMKDPDWWRLAVTIVLSSGALASDRRLPPDTTAWINDSS